MIAVIFETSNTLSLWSDIGVDQDFSLHIKQSVGVVICALKNLNAKVVVDRTGPILVDPSPVKFVCVDQVVTNAGRVVEEKIRLFAALAVADADDG